MQGLKSVKSVRGTIFIIVMLISMLMILIGVSASNMLLQDVHMVKYLKRSMQAQYLAEAGVSIALATIATDGEVTSFTSGGNQTMDPGEYNFSVAEIAGVGWDEDRWLVSATGTVDGISRTASIEIKDVSTEAMNFALSAGNNVTMHANNGTITISGDIHANNNMTLKEQGGDITVLASAGTTGKATCSGDLPKAYDVDDEVSLADVEGSGVVEADLSEPIFNFAYFKDVADNQGGIYHDSGQSFGNQDLTGGTAGIIYVDGDVTFTGTCTITGGFVANGSITLNQGNSLTQTHDDDNDNRFPIFMSETGTQIRLYGEFSTADGNIVYASGNVKIQTPGTVDTFMGTVIAGGTFSITANTNLEITYGLITAWEAVPLVLEVVSWNK